MSVKNAFSQIRIIQVAFDWNRLLTLCSLLLALACGPGGDPAQEHRKRAEAYLLNNQTQEALIELYQATRLRPDDLELHLRAAEIFSQLGHFSESAGFYRDALSIEPNDSTLLLLGHQLLLGNLPEAIEVANELLENDPSNAQAWLLLAEIALLNQDVKTAQAHLLQARKANPEEPEIDWMTARINEVKAAQAHTRNPLARVSSRLWQSTVQAYDRYLVKKGERALEAQLRRAHALTLVRGRQDESLRAHQSIIESPLESYSPIQKREAFVRIYNFAQRSKNPELAQAAIDRILEINPNDRSAWQYQARLYDELNSQERDEAYKERLTDSADQTSMQLVYSEHIAKTQGVNSAIAFLKKQRLQNEDEAALPAQMIDLLQREGRLKDAQKALNEAGLNFSSETSIQILQARQAFLAEQYASAIRLIEEIPEYERGQVGFQVLAQAQMKLHLNEEALQNINTGIAYAHDVDPSSLRIKAQILLNLNKNRQAAATLIKLWKITELTSQEQILLAGAYYDSRTPGVGRKLLTRMLSDDPGNVAVALYLYRQESANPSRRDFLTLILDQALAVNPNDHDLLEALTDLDLEAGAIQKAMARVEKTISKSNWLGPPYLTRARIHLAQGRVKPARDDAERARLLDRKTAEQSYEIQALAYLMSADPQIPIALMEKRAQAGDLPADRIALLARLQLHLGNKNRAQELYEQALAAGSRLNHVKNDLALLLAESELASDLKRAESLALSAVKAPGKQINANDTLGYVYLQQDKNEAAYWKFRYVIENTSDPNPEYHIHMAMALLALDRREEALQSVHDALALDPEFVPATQLKASMELQKSDPAS